MAAMAKIVRVKVEKDQVVDRYYATSPDLKGLLVSRRSVEELDGAIKQAVTELLEAYGMRAFVTKAEDGEGPYRPWVAVPIAALHAAL